MIDTPFILMYDGQCGLCHAAVRFLYHQDKHHRFTYVPLNSSLGKQLTSKSGIDTTKIDSIILLEQEMAYYIKSRAVLKSLHALGGLWRISYLLMYVPVCPLDFIYDKVAKYRSKWFKKPQCSIPSKIDSRYFREA